MTSNSRAYHRALELYAARTGITPRDSTFNIVQDIVQAVLEEIYEHSAIQAGETIQFTTDPNVVQPLNTTTGTLTQDLTVVQK